MNFLTLLKINIVHTSSLKMLFSELDFSKSLDRPVADNTITSCDTAKLIRLNAKNTVCATCWAVLFNGQQSLAAVKTPDVPVATAKQPPHNPPPICNQNK